MKFSFNQAPSWFTQYLVDNYLDEFHAQVKDTDYVNNIVGLIDAAVEFFDQKGFRVYQYNRQLWFDIDETPEYTLLALQYAD